MNLDLVIRLRDARNLAGLTQKEAAEKSGVGDKTISSFETGERISSLMVTQLSKLLAAYNLTEAEFFGQSFEDKLVMQKAKEDAGISGLITALTALEESRRVRLVRSFLRMTAAARESQRRGTRLYETKGRR